MAEEKKIDLLDYFVILVKWKKFLIALLFPFMIITYLGIYFLIEEQFDSSTLLVPAEDASLGGISGLIGNFGANLPFDIGAGSSPEMNMYNTIIYSRTNLQRIIDEFDLLNVYGLHSEIKGYKEKALKSLAGSIEASETEFSAYKIKVRSNSPQLSADITNFIVKLLNEKFCSGKSKKEIIGFINDYVYVDKNASLSIYNYFFEQFNYAEIPSNSRIIVEHYTNDRGIKHTIFHTLYGRRVNDCLSRAVAFAISKSQHRDVEIGINDNGFYVASEKTVNVMHAFKLIKSKDFRKVLNMAIDRTEVLK
ncbi:MAG: hypothetical protein IH819_01180, partial [Bacteroidetes bacterium]|nr:hypothetical protein [Bacteroidota bacterium]